MEKADTFQWLTTAPNPRTPATGYDAGQRGWRFHAVEAQESEKFVDLRGRASVCGVIPRHGWGMDLFIEEKCKRCLRKIKKL